MEENAQGYIWPILGGCSSIVIKKFAKMTDERDGVPAVSERIITNKEDIEALFASMESIATQGEKFISFSDEAEEIHVVFMYNLESGTASQDHLYIFDGKVQRPDTTFGAPVGEDAEKEKAFVDLLEGYLK